MGKLVHFRSNLLYISLSKQIKGAFQFKEVETGDTPLVHHWLDKPHVAKWWDEQSDSLQSGLTRSDLMQFVAGKNSVFEHWLCYYKNVPIAYLITSDANDDGADYLHHYLEPNGQNIELGFFIGEEKFLNKKLSHRIITNFLNRLSHTVKACFVVVQTNNLKAIRTYEKSNFRQVGMHKPTSGPLIGEEFWIMRYLANTEQI